MRNRVPAMPWPRSRIRGSFDLVRRDVAVGWAQDRERPARRLAIEILVDGVSVATGTADEPRDDVASAGHGDGRCGFSIPLPQGAVPPGFDPDRILARVTGSRTAIRRADDFTVETPSEVGCLESVDGWTATGWAADLGSGLPARVEFLVGGVVVGEATAEAFRDDVRAAGYGEGRAGFSAHLNVTPEPGRTVLVEARFRESGRPLLRSPQAFSLPGYVTKWLSRSSRASPEAVARLRRRTNRAVGAQRLSIVMPVHDIRADWLTDAIGSVRAQWCDAWELICVDDGSTDPAVAAVLAEAAGADPRITVISLDRNLGIAGAVNRGLSHATGEFVAFLDHDDRLEPDAVHRVLLAAREGADLLYSDEIITGQDIGELLHLVARPAFSHDYYLSHPYFVHFIAVRRALALALGGWDEGMAISADVDFVLRVLGRAETVTHIPLPLYRWRTHAGSAGHARKAAVTDATLSALNRHLDRLGIAGRATAGFVFNSYAIDLPDTGGRVAVIVPTRDNGALLRACVAGVERTTRPGEVRLVVIDHETRDPDALQALKEAARHHRVVRRSGAFNFAAMNNEAVRLETAGCDYLLFMNDDVEVGGTGWLPRLRSICGRPDVGAVGATLVYPDGRVQHAGVVLGLNRRADHSHKFMPLTAGRDRVAGFNGSLVSLRDYSAVTAACMMVRKTVFEALGGFDEGFAIGFNDTDFCLRLGLAGFKILNDARTVFVHHESATRTRTREVDHPEDDLRFTTRWREILTRGDPFYHPLLSVEGPDHKLTSRLDRPFTPRTRPVGLGKPAPSG